MASIVAEPSPRNWWFSKSVSSKLAKDANGSLSEKPPKPSNGAKFNSLASALGFKAKKQLPALAIQDRPPPLPVFPPTQPVKQRLARQPTNRYANRPPSNSVSSTVRSSIELRTPSDTPKDPLPFRQSLLSLSDPDPFASQGMSPPLSGSKPSLKSPIADVPAFESRRFSAHFTVDSIPSVSTQPSPLSNRQSGLSTGSKSSLKYGFFPEISILKS